MRPQLIGDNSKQTMCAWQVTRLGEGKGLQIIRQACIAGAAAWAQAHDMPQVSEITDEEKIRKGLDESKYQGM